MLVTQDPKLTFDHELVGAATRGFNICEFADSWSSVRIVGRQIERVIAGLKSKHDPVLALARLGAMDYA